MYGRILHLKTATILEYARVAAVLVKEDAINAAIDYFLSLLPSHFRDKLRLSVCES